MEKALPCRFNRSALKVINRLRSQKKIWKGNKKEDWILNEKLTDAHVEKTKLNKKMIRTWMKAKRSVKDDSLHRAYEERTRDEIVIDEDDESDAIEVLTIVACA